MNSIERSGVVLMEMGLNSIKSFLEQHMQHKEFLYMQDLDTAITTDLYGSELSRGNMLNSIENSFGDAIREELEDESDIL